jgi:hypothetical protein
LIWLDEAAAEAAWGVVECLALAFCDPRGL